MKLCSQCKTGFPDKVETCPTHGGVLSEIGELEPGMVIHKTYRIVRRLGRGGMGVVYLADHIFMGQQRALKFLPSELCEEVGFTDRFRREAQALRELRHKNVVDSGDLEPAEDDSLFFAMEFVNGGNLCEFLRTATRPFDVELALQITRGIAEGLSAAHVRNMVHRDIKPENILMARVGEARIPKIADFGIVALKESSNLTGTGARLLTMAYAAPEQWRGTRAAELDGRTDLYALGGVLFEMLTGETVFRAGNYDGWEDQHLNVAPRPPSSLRPDLKNWRGLDELVLCLLAKDREKRPRDVIQFLGLLGGVKYVDPTVFEGGRNSKPPIPPKRRAPPLRQISKWVLGVALTVACIWLAVHHFPSASVQPAHVPSPPMLTSVGGSHPTPQSSQNPTLLASPPKPDTNGIEQRGEVLFDRGNYRDAKPLLEEACKAGKERACVDLGLIYQLGRSVDPDKGKAFDLYDKACNSRDQLGCTYLAYYYHEGLLVPRDTEKANLMYVNACASGVGIACVMAGRHYEDEKSYEDAKRFYTKGCDYGAPAACDNLGILYATGESGSINSTASVGFFAKACELGFANACYNLGYLYDDGIGMDKDKSKALRLYTKACDLGNSWACNNGGIISYQAGDYARALNFYTKGCNGGLANACSGLGDLYSHGAGVSKDLEKAAQLKEKACAAGVPEACAGSGSSK